MATIKRNSNLYLANACKELYDSIRGVGTNKEKLIQVIVDHDNIQRQQIKEKFKFMYDTKLIDEIRSEYSVSSDLKSAISSLLDTPHEYDAKTLHQSLHVLTSEKTAFVEVIKNKKNVKSYAIIEVMVTRSHEELKLIKDAYKKKYKKDLDKEFKKNHFLSHSFIKLLRTLAVHKRSENNDIDKEQAIRDATILLKKEKIGFTYEDQLIKLFTDRSFAQLAQIIDEYSNHSGKDLRDTIEKDKELESDFKECMNALIDCSIDIPTYFAKRIHCYLDYIYGAKDKSLIRVIVSRSEKDLQLIKDRYYNLYYEKLADAVNKRVHGHFKDLLMKILRD